VAFLLPIKAKEVDDPSDKALLQSTFGSNERLDTFTLFLFSKEKYFLRHIDALPKDCPLS